MHLSIENLIKELINQNDYLTVSEAESDNPAYCGIYSIIINDLTLLPKEIIVYQRRYSKYNNIIYIGMANPQTIKKRLIVQDLQNKGAAIFFRKLGSVQGYIALKGSGKNYKFEKEDKIQLINWIAENLQVKYYRYSSDIFSKKETENNYEKPLIEFFQPAFNDRHNSVTCQFIKDIHLINRNIGLNRIYSNP